MGKKEFKSKGYGNPNPRRKQDSFHSKNRQEWKYHGSDKTRDIVLSRATNKVNKVEWKRKKRGEAVKNALSRVKELAKFAGGDSDRKCLPYGHRGWISGQQQPDRVPVPKEKLDKYNRGSGYGKKIKDQKLLEKEKDIEYSVEQSARAEILLPETPGTLEVDEGEKSTQFTQEDIVKSVDITTAAKRFELFMKDFGPYRINYTRNGRNLLLGGRKGHIAAFDWLTKKPLCEINVMEECFDVQWFHNELMFAVAQKRWVYIYDKQGVEIHCLKNLFEVLCMDFLPYHFLLATSSSRGFLTWVDVSVGRIVSQFNTRKGRLNMMAQNPYNAVICLGHSEGTVTMWSPNNNKPLASMLCHRKPLSSLAINPTGMYMATSAVDGATKIWDLRQLSGPLQDYYMGHSASHMAFSDRSILARSHGNVVELYQDCCRTTADSVYLRHRTSRPISDIQFCPFEDVLGVGAGWGFSSLIVPGAGEPNYDALENNPFQTAKQRQEAEVKSLLEKIQPELITLDPHAIGDINIPTLQEKLEAKQQLMLGKLPKIDFTPRKKGKLKGTVRATRAKKIVQEAGKREMIKTIKGLKEQEQEKLPKQDEDKVYSVLDRFIPKKRK